MGKLQIDILGTSFTIQARENEEYLRKLLTYYREITDTIKASGSVGSSLETSILAGISLVDELFKEKQKSQIFSKTIEKNAPTEEDAIAEKITLDLIKKIDQVL